MSMFAKGKKVRAIRDTKSYGMGDLIQKGAVLEVSVAIEDGSASLFNAWRPNGVDHYALAKDDFEPADATPTPLDPKSVHVGDTVTVRFIETGDVLTTKAYQPDDVTKPGEWVYLLGWPLNKPMGHGLAVTKFEILAIEPAPKPEPEWEPGTVGTATVRTVPNIRVMRLDGVTQPWASATFFAPAGDVKGEGQNRHDDWQVTDFVPDEPRAVWSRQGLRAALVHSDSLKTDPGTGMTYIDPDLATERLAAYMRGESR